MDELARRRIPRIEAQPVQSDNVVFLVTRGVDEDYHILGAFSTETRAAAFASRCRSGLVVAGFVERVAVEVFTVDEYVYTRGAFWVQVGVPGVVLRDEIVAWGFDPTGDPNRPADTADAVELDGAPQHWKGYGASVAEAHVAALALRDSMVQT